MVSETQIVTIDNQLRLILFGLECALDVEFSVAAAEKIFADSERDAVSEKRYILLVCYLAQQCAEKYLKARLQKSSVAFPKTHNLPALLVLVLPVEASWNVLKVALTKLDDYSVEFR